MRSILACLHRNRLKGNPFRVIVSYPEGHITGSMILRRSRDADIQRTVQEINSKIEAENVASSENDAQRGAG